MNKRFSQLRELSVKRKEINPKNININILNDLPENILKEFIIDFIDKNDFSENDLKNLQLKLKILSGEEIDKNISIIKFLYKTLTEKILLPNYLNGKNKNIIFQELSKIIERTERKTENILNKINKDGFFYINFSDIEGIFYEYELTGFLPETTFDLGGLFGQLTIESNAYDDFIINIPIKIGKKVKALDKDNSPKNFIDEKDLDKILNQFITGKGEIKNFKNNKNIFIEIDNFYDKKNNNSYKNIKISHKDIKKLEKGASIEEVKNILNDVFSSMNFIINKISNNSGIEQNPRYLNYNSGIDIFNRINEQEEIENFHLTKEEINNFEKKFVLKLSDKIKINEIGGQERAKEEVEKIIKGIQFEDIMKSWGAKSTSGIVFEGPSGTGKTLLAKAIASEVDATILNVKLTDIASSAFINEGANNITKLFSFVKYKAKKNNNKIIIILDELDALFAKRGSSNSSGEDTKIVNTFLTEMNGLENLENVIIIGTTNLIGNIDNAVIRSGRLSTKIKVDLPDKKGLEEIYKIHIKKAKKRSKKFNDLMKIENLEKIISESSGLSGADIEEILRIILENKALEEIDGKEITKISENDFFDAIKKVKISENKIKMGF